MARPIEKIEISPEEEQELKRRIASPKTSKRDHLRSEIILLRGSGLGGKTVAECLSVSQNCVSKWTARFKHDGIEGLTDKPGRGRKVSIPIEKAEAVLSRISRPPEGRTRWSTRSMGNAVGV